MKIIDHIHLVPDVVANPFIIVDLDGLTIVDVGIPFSQKKILAYVASLGKSARDVKRIILTHSDVDHVGSLDALQKATGARTYASRIEAEAIAIGRTSRIANRPGRFIFKLIGPFFKVAPVKIDEILVGDQVLPVLGGLRVVETPGHTPGHISLFSPETGILFCGDSMMSEGDTLRPFLRKGVTWDSAKVMESMRMQAELGPKIVCPGHGPVVMDAAGKFPI